MQTSSARLLVIAIFTLVLIAMVNLAWWMYYSRTEQMLDTQLSRRLVALARVGASGVTSGEIDQLKANDLGAYADVSSRLEELRSSDSLAEAFILDDRYRYLATTLMESDSVYFLSALNGSYIDSLFFGTVHQARATASYSVKDVVLKSAFAPIADSSGSVIAVLGVEASVDYSTALAQLRRNLWYATGLSIMGGLVLGLVFLALQRRLNLIEQRLFLGETHSFMGRMVAVVAHEVKNPLGIIRASAERMLKKHQAEEAKYIIEESDRLNALVTGYLDFAKAEKSLVATETAESFDLVELIGSVRTHFLARFGEQHAQWVEDGLPPSLRIVGFPRALRQVILNLLVNGAEACQGAGRPIKVGVEMHEHEREVRLAVIDYGPGMSAREIRRVFAPFYTTKPTGSGLGLYLSKQLVDEMRGRLTVESRKGEPTRMILHLPRQAAN